MPVMVCLALCNRKPVIQSANSQFAQLDISRSLILVLYIYLHIIYKTKINQNGMCHTDDDSNESRNAYLVVLLC